MGTNSSGNALPRRPCIVVTVPPPCLSMCVTEGMLLPLGCRSGILHGGSTTGGPMVHARIIGSNSFAIMDSACARGSHGTWNHDLPCQAPHPHDPDASDAISTTGRSGRNDIPFHSTLNSCHQARSERKPALRRMGVLDCGGRWTLCRRSIIRRKNARPDCTTLHA